MPRKRIGRPPKSITTLESQTSEDATPPKKRGPGRPPKARKTPDAEASASFNVAGASRKGVVDPNIIDDQVLIGTGIGVGIAERIKWRQRSPEAPTDTDDADRNEDAGSSMNSDEYIQNGNVGNSMDSDDDEDSSGDSAEESAFVEDTSEGEVEDELPIAAYVKRQRRAQGVAASTREPPRSSDSSSDSEPEIPLSEMTATQRGRYRGKMNAVRDLWGR
jgi:hypothetical protein